MQPVLKKAGIRFAGGAALRKYTIARGVVSRTNPNLIMPLLTPSAVDARPIGRFDNFIKSVEQARRGASPCSSSTAYPDTAPRVGQLPRRSDFDAYMNYLAKNLTL